MGANSLMVIGQRGRLGGTSTPLTRQAPASPIVLKHLMQAIANLGQKVDALAVRDTQVPQVMPRHIVSSKTIPVESTEIDYDDSPPPTQQRNTRVRRSSLLEFFD